MNSAQQKLGNFKGDHLSVNMFTGGKFLNDAIRVFDAGMTSGQKNVNSASGQFTGSMVGRVVYVEGAGPSGVGLLSTVASFVSPTRITTLDAASATVTNKEARVGQDSTASFQGAITAISVTKKNGGRFTVPKGMYLTTGTITVPSHVRIEGECYVNTSVLAGAPVEPPSYILCCQPVPVFSTDGTPCFSPAFSKLGVSGVPQSGSKGIYGLTVWNCLIEDCFFENFGDQAIHLEEYLATTSSSVTGIVKNNFAENCCRVRTRSAFVGVFDLGATDMFVHDNNINASMDTEGVVSNKIAALAMRGAQGFVRHNQCGHSEIGVYVGLNCSGTVFTDVRADNNQGRGWVIDGNANGFGLCRSFANSQASDGTYNAVEIYGSGNSLIGFRNNWNGLGFGPLSARVNNVFATFNNNTTEPNYCDMAHIGFGSHLGAEYLQSGTQVFPHTDITSFDPPGFPTMRVGGADFTVQDQSYYHVKKNTPANEGSWRTFLNYGVGFSQLLFQIINDARTAVTNWLQVDRTGAGVVNFVRFPGSPVEFTGGDLKIVHDTAQFKFISSTGVPRAVSTLYGGTGSTVYGVNLPLKTNSGGNAFLTGAIALNSAEVANQLLVANGGTGADNVVAARTNLGVYSKAEVDAAIGAAVSAHVGIQTGSTSGHTHTQN